MSSHERTHSACFKVKDYVTVHCWVDAGCRYKGAHTGANKFQPQASNRRICN